MTYNPKIHNRRSIRLRDYDYSTAGAYFITACAHDRSSLFGNIVDSAMQLNSIGQMVRQCWNDIPAHFPHVELDSVVVMPNHIHGILCIVDSTAGAKKNSPLHPPTHSPQQTPYTQPANGTSRTIGSVIRGFKIGVTNWVRKNTTISNVWQRNYWEHIVRSEQELKRIQRYIQNNPAQWELDHLNPVVIGQVGDLSHDDGNAEHRGGCKGEKNFTPTIRESTTEYMVEAQMV